MNKERRKLKGLSETTSLVVCGPNTKAIACQSILDLIPLLIERSGGFSSGKLQGVEVTLRTK